MSFSFSFTAKSPRAAKRQLEKEHAPSIVKAAIEDALSGVKETAAVKVTASGHLPEMPCNEVHAYSTSSSITVAVEPITFVE